VGGANNPVFSANNAPLRGDWLMLNIGLFAVKTVPLWTDWLMPNVGFFAAQNESKRGCLIPDIGFYTASNVCLFAVYGKCGTN